MIRLVVGTYFDGAERLGTVTEMPQVTEPEGILSSGGNLRVQISGAAVATVGRKTSLKHIGLKGSSEHQ